jgi:hypothetical protein
MVVLVNEILIFLGVTTVLLNRIVTENLKIGRVGDKRSITAQAVSHNKNSRNARESVLALQLQYFN